MTIQTPPFGSTDDDPANRPHVLLPEVTVYVHEIDTAAHPTYQPGTWRWAVQVGGRPPHELAACVNAGGERSLSTAIDVGDQVAAAVVLALRLFGVPVGRIRHVVLDHDPIPPGHDFVHDLRKGG